MCVKVFEGDGKGGEEQSVEKRGFVCCEPSVEEEGEETDEASDDECDKEFDGRLRDLAPECDPCGEQKEQDTQQVSTKKRLCAEVTHHEDGSEPGGEWDHPAASGDDDEDTSEE